MTRKPRTIDEYLAPLDVDKRAALERLRATIRKAYPKAEECISYSVPAFRLNGKVIAWFAAAKNHCSYFPGIALDDVTADVAEFKAGKGTLRFTPDKPIPAALVRKLIKARIARVSGR